MTKKRLKNPWKIVSIVLFAFVVLTQVYSMGKTLILQLPFLSGSGKAVSSPTPSTGTVDFAKISDEILPAGGVELPISWGSFGQKLIAAGVIDKAKFEKLFEQQGLSDDDRKLIDGYNNGRIRITSKNSQLILDLLWAFGLGNKNAVLDNGPISQDPTQTGNMASTGGWDGLSVGKAMSHFSKHQLLILTPNQQSLVEEVAKGVFRPCCGNSTYFPDCNHGMAMLGALEIGAAQGLSRDELFRLALVLNQHWFSQTYIELAVYFQENGIPWEKVNPEEVLGAKYSSGQGYATVRRQIKSLPSFNQGGGGCGA